ncbi:hypothetical protein TSAR_000750 [Trichomalopsis sarcophagae]|uniref:ornithine decarboxylase n=1 Tax=Trichomalopsis sarcophagae TaxID=543379 RepID=A0A232F6S1_9HYME|nr:hypothetical protein TSAR_000750 [Trichomalopsis sarcophagae]
MANFDLSEIKIVDDHTSELEMLRNLVNEKDDENTVHLLNVGEIIRKHQLWVQKMPRVVPYYAVKCNPNPTIIKVLAALGGHFDCASKGEIIQVMQYEVPSDKIIFANPIKFPSHLEYARKVGVDTMTADSEEELKKIRKLYPDAKVVIRIRCDSTVRTARTHCLDDKFGCDPSSDAVQLIKMTLDLGLQLHGFSFHAGSPCEDAVAICRGIYRCKDLIDTAKTMGCRDVKLIDIGGGFPGERDFILDEFADMVNNALEDIDSSVEIISEPGRFIVASACNSAAYVIGKKTVMKENQKTFMYYITDGVYGSFNEELCTNNYFRSPVSSFRNRFIQSTSTDDEKYPSSVWGPTCDSFDVVLKNSMLPEFNVGDWLVWADIGAYSTSCANNFNSLQIPKVHPIMRRKDWLDFLLNYLSAEVKNGQNNEIY